MQTCTRCGNTGFLNISQVDDDVLEEFDSSGDVDIILEWVKTHDADTQICDCCGDGDSWYGEPGFHYSSEDPPGNSGPYAYNGGLCKCH